MSKRFIDTQLFDDPWFMDLSKDAKLLWIYMITKCNHAGIIEINEKLCKFQTGIKDLITLYKELGNRLVTVSQQLFFIPNFLKFQYPNFPKSNVLQQKSAIEILNKYKLFDNSSQTLTQGLVNSYEYEYVNNNDNKEEDTSIKSYNYNEFYDQQFLLSNNDINYERFIKVLFGENTFKRPLEKILKMPEQISWEQFESLLKIKIDYSISIREILEDMESWKDLNKNKTVLGTFRTFAKRHAK